MYTSIVSMLQNLHLIKFVKDNIFYLFKKKKKNLFVFIQNIEP